MRPLGWIVSCALALVVTGSAAVPALAADDPIISFDSRSEIEVDLKMIVDDFLPDLLEMAKAEDPQKAQMLEMAVELLGVRALDRFHMTSVASKTEGVYRSTVTLDPQVEGGLMRTMFAVPDGTFRFGRYLPSDGAALLVSLVNFSEGLKALYGMVTGPEMAALIPPMLIQDEEGGGITVFGINFERDIFPLLQGELDLVIFPFTVDQMGPGAQPPMAIVLGTSDGPALRARLFELLGSRMGEDAAAEFESAAGEKVGAFTFYPLPGDAAYAVGDEFLVVTSDPDRLRALLARPGGDLPEKKARQYVRISTAFFLEAMAARAQEGGPAEREMFAEIFGTLDEEAPQFMELTTNAAPNRLDTEVRQPGNLWSLEYQMLRNMITAMPKFTAANARRDKYTATVAMLDEAFTQYGVDHGGNFPEYPEELAEAGYLDAFPDLTETPLGVYADGAYTYVTLTDEKGRVKGYYFFLYGLGEGTGFDIFDGENTADPAAFRPASDGVNDGVVSFCYDGLALEPVRRWREQN